jgi:ABC-type branched-subunit amino acid transport system substrate-binding protein
MARQPPPARGFIRPLIGVSAVLFCLLFFSRTAHSASDTASAAAPPATPVRVAAAHPAGSVRIAAASPATPVRIAAAQPAVPPRIGVLLPLSGRFALPGQEVKRGLELALQELSGASVDTPMLVYRDTQDDAERTAKAVHELVEEEKVVAIIGPLVSATVDVAAKAAAELKVPLIALSQKSDIPHLGEYVFRDFMTPEAQMKSLVAYAMDELGLSRFAIIHPEQRYGMELAGLFWDEVVRRGGHITGIESYPVGTTDFLNVARRAGGKFYRELRAKEFSRGEAEYLRAFKEAGKKPGRPYELPPIVDYDAVFVPDQYKTAALIASTLAYMEIPIGGFTVSKDQTPVRLLGLNAWDTPDLSLQGGEYVEDSLFVDAFFAQSPDPKVRAFVSSFQQAYGKAPDLLAATGYDALGLLATLLKTPVTDREALRERIAHMTPHEGVTGSVAFDEHGDLKKPLFVVSVHRKQLVQLSPVVDEAAAPPSKEPRAKKREKGSKDAGSSSGDRP